MADFRISAAKYLRKERGYKYVNLLGKGSYGTVLQMQHKINGMVAVKMVSKKLTNTLEIDSWKHLRHENILKLMFIDQSLESCVIFVTELMKLNLTKRLQEKTHREDPEALNNNKRYIKDILSGLEYLHGQDLCHLDLRADNIFLSFKGIAVIADFSGLCRCNERKGFCPLPRCFRPPEMLKTKKKVWPKPIDLWCCGLLAAHLFFIRRFYRITLLQDSVGTVEATKSYVEAFENPVKILSAISKNFPNCKMSTGFVNEFISFVNLFLQEKPKKRCQAFEALRHVFLSFHRPNKSSSVDQMSLPSCSTRSKNLDSVSLLNATLAVSSSTEYSSESSQEAKVLLSEGTKCLKANHYHTSSQSFLITDTDKDIKSCETYKSNKALLSRHTVSQTNASNPISTLSSPDPEFTSEKLVAVQSALCKSITESRDFLMSNKAIDGKPCSPGLAIRLSVPLSKWKRFKKRLCRVKNVLRKK